MFQAGNKSAVAEDPELISFQSELSWRTFSTYSSPGNLQPRFVALVQHRWISSYPLCNILAKTAMSPLQIEWIYTSTITISILYDITLHFSKTKKT